MDPFSRARSIDKVSNVGPISGLVMPQPLRGYHVHPQSAKSP